MSGTNHESQAGSGTTKFAFLLVHGLHDSTQVFVDCWDVAHHPVKEEFLS